MTHPDAVPVALEVTDPASVAAATAQTQDVTVLINNAGASVGASFLTSPVDDVRREFETTSTGGSCSLAPLCRSLSATAAGTSPTCTPCCPGSRSAVPTAPPRPPCGRKPTPLRLELEPRGIAVTGLHVGYVDTDLTAGVDAPKSDPRHVAALALDGIETGAHELLADDISHQVKAGLADDLAGLYEQLTK